MNLEHRIERLERANGRLRRVVALLVVLSVSWPLLSAISARTTRDDVVRIAGPDGSEVRLEHRAGEGLGLFLVGKTGEIRGRLALVGEQPRLEIGGPKDKANVAVETTDKGAAIGIRQGDAWRVRHEVMGGVPRSSLFDGAEVERVRIGIFKDEPVVTLRDGEGKDRAWMVVERGPHASVAVRGSGRSEVALHARANDPCGIGLRSANGKMKVGIVGDDAYGQMFVYGPDEMSRVVTEAREGRQVIEVVDSKNRKRAILGVEDDRARTVLQDRSGAVFEDRSEGPSEAVRKDGETDAPPTGSGSAERKDG
ncbi:MAG: hypothetical protein KDC95_02065 [Planctomycetes bacterium]|nr:hypothetical protein [Planctomycetota bacterium]